MEVKTFLAETLRDLNEQIEIYEEESSKRILSIHIQQYTVGWEAKVCAI